MNKTCEINKSVLAYRLPGVPMVREGSDVASVIDQTLKRDRIRIGNRDILAVAQKIVSRAERRIVSLDSYQPTPFAESLAKKTGRNARLIQAILDESTEIRRVDKGTPEHKGVVVTRHRLGFVLTSAGIDSKNVGGGKNDDDKVMLLPIDPDRSARKIAAYFKKMQGVKIGVIIVDSLGDPDRMGAVGKAIGVANVPARLVRREKDIEDKIKNTDIAFADGIAALAMLMMGQANEMSPVVVIRGLDYSISPRSKISDVLIL